MRETHETVINTDFSNERWDWSPWFDFCFFCFFPFYILTVLTSEQFRSLWPPDVVQKMKLIILLLRLLICLLSLVTEANEDKDVFKPSAKLQTQKQKQQRRPICFLKYKPHEALQLRSVCFHQLTKPSIWSRHPPLSLRNIHATIRQRLWLRLSWGFV